MLSAVKPDDGLIEKYKDSFRDIKYNYLMKTDGIERNVLLYIITCNLFNIRPVAGDPMYWPFQYVKESRQTVYTPDYFTEKALSLVQNATVREQLGLSFKDVLTMDYGTFMYIEDLVKELEEARYKEEKNLQNNLKQGLE